jgi:hypothetical protein
MDQIFVSGQEPDDLNLEAKSLLINIPHTSSVDDLTALGWYALELKDVVHLRIVSTPPVDGECKQCPVSLETAFGFVRLFFDGKHMQSVSFVGLPEFTEVVGNYRTGKAVGSILRMELDNIGWTFIDDDGDPYDSYITTFARFFVIVELTIRVKELLKFSSTMLAMQFHPKALILHDYDGAEIFQVTELTGLVRYLLIVDSPYFPGKLWDAVCRLKCPDTLVECSFKNAQGVGIDWKRPKDVLRSSDPEVKACLERLSLANYDQNRMVETRPERMSIADWDEYRMVKANMWRSLCGYHSPKREILKFIGIDPEAHLTKHQTTPAVKRKFSEL